VNHIGNQPVTPAPGQ